MLETLTHSPEHLPARPRSQDSITTEELPGYVTEPEVQPFKPDNFTRFLQIDSALRTLDYGSFTTGKVVVSPKKVVPPGSLILDIVGTEQALVENGQFWKSNKTSVRRFVCSRVIIPFECPLEPNHRYKFPFSLQFPINYDSIECKNGLNHCTIPPTLGVGCEIELSPYGALIDYHIRAYFLGTTSVFCRRNLTFTPRRCLLFDLETFVDESGKSIDRVYSSHARLTNKSFRGSLLALVALHGRPFRHDADSKQGVMTFDFEFIPANDTVTAAQFQDNFSTSFVIRKVIYAAPDGIGNKLCKTEKNTVKSYRVASGKVSTSFEWEGNLAHVSAAYEIEQPLLLRTPNFVSCHTAVSYEFDIVLKHKNMTTTLTVPMIIHYPRPAPYYDSC